VKQRSVIRFTKHLFRRYSTYMGAYRGDVATVLLDTSYLPSHPEVSSK
jgi:hypothetical protein